MELTIIAIFVVVIVGLVGGYLLATHVHTVAAAVVSASQRATTIPSGDVAALNAKIGGLGTQLQTSTDALSAHVTSTINTAVAALPAAPPAAPPAA